MSLTALKQKALAVLAQLNTVRTMPPGPQKDALWQKIGLEMKQFPKARPGLRVVYSSSLKRAATTAQLAATTYNNLPAINTTTAIKEILLGHEFDDDLTAQSEHILANAAHQNEALEKLKMLYAERGLPEPLADTPENRRALSDPEASFEGGDTTQGYAARIIRGYAAILTHAAEGGARPVEDILPTLPEPSEAAIRQTFALQQNLQLPPASRASLYNPKLAYAPLVALCQNLKGQRVVFARHGDTSFSQQKILTGGHIDAGLIDEGADAAIETGILLKLYNKCRPNDVKIIQIYGHSAASSIVEAAFCAASPQMQNPTNGQYKVAEPHVFNFLPSGTITVEAVSRQSLEAALRQELETERPN